MDLKGNTVARVDLQDGFMVLVPHVVGAFFLHDIGMWQVFSANKS